MAVVDEEIPDYDVKRSYKAMKPWSAGLWNPENVDVSRGTPGNNGASASVDCLCVADRE